MAQSTEIFYRDKFVYVDEFAMTVVFMQIKALIPAYMTLSPNSKWLLEAMPIWENGLKWGHGMANLRLDKLLTDTHRIKDLTQLLDLVQRHFHANFSDNRVPIRYITDDLFQGGWRAYILTQPIDVLHFDRVINKLTVLLNDLESPDIYSVKR